MLNFYCFILALKKKSKQSQVCLFRLTESVTIAMVNNRMRLREELTQNLGEKNSYHFSEHLVEVYMYFVTDFSSHHLEELSCLNLLKKLREIINAKVAL